MITIESSEMHFLRPIRNGAFSGADYEHNPHSFFKFSRKQSVMVKFRRHHYFQIARDVSISYALFFVVNYL